MRLVYIKLIFSSIFWGSSAIAGKILLESIMPSQVTFLRFFIAFLILCVFILINRKYVVRVSILDHLKLAVLGFVGIALCYYFYFKGLYYSTAFNAGLIESTIPLVTLAISVIIKEEKFDLINTIGFVLAYIGVVIIVTRMDLSVIISSNYNFGDILLLLGTLCFGLYNVLLRRYKFSFDSQYIKLLLIFMYGSFALLVWLLIDMKDNDLKWIFSVKDIICLIILSLGASVLAYVFFNDGIHKIGASKASSFINKSFKLY
jgi:drug/metabolite transporter (DMT)-like permease